jgi:hypothetical protein
MAVLNITVVMECPGGCRLPMRLIGRDRCGDERWLRTALCIHILLLLMLMKPKVKENITGLPCRQLTLYIISTVTKVACA